MAEIIKKATNRFSKGLVMDFSPENTKKEVLTHALNATLLTFNGNELSLQNDMGNARVETAYLPEGYIPVGTCEYGGIIYIVSYNPLEDKSLIGCFPSPERNISREELGRSDDVSIKYTDFLETAGGELTGNLKNTSCKVLLRDSNLNPGDKFIVYANDSIYQEQLLDLYKWDGSEFTQVNHPMVALNLVSILDNGKIIYLNSDVRKYEVSKNDDKFKYHILGQLIDGAGNKVDVDSYRNVLSSGYSVFKEKTSGKLALLAELVTIDTFSLTLSIILDGETKCSDIDCYKFKVVLHPEVSPEVNELNYLQVPKLKYLWVNNTNNQITYFNELGDYTTGKYTDADLYILNKNKKHIFNTPAGSSYEDISIQNLQWSFPNDSYYANYAPEGLILKLTKGEYYSGYVKQFEKISSEDIRVHKFAGSEIEDTAYKVDEVSEFLFAAIRPLKDIELTSDNFQVNFDANYIEGLDKSTLIPDSVSSMKCLSTPFLVNQPEYKYEDIEFASFQLPKSLVDAGILFPFKYTYNITPCMEYGKLDFLSVSNEIDLKNLYNFKASNFTTWKYRIDGNLLMLTVGADVFDTFEQDKVDGLFLEFYDWRGFAGSLEITGKKSYSGKFTKVIELNSLGALSKNKIRKISSDGGEVYELTNSFNRNINILPNEKAIGKYDYNGLEVTYMDDVLGWANVVNTQDGATHKWNNLTHKYEPTYKDATHKLESFNGENDCGTLYSNLIYGVKPYLRREVNGKKVYIEKDSMFLFTIPVYNDYYYKVTNFNYLTDPKLKLVLTYKLDDVSTVEPFVNLNDEDLSTNVKNGYQETVFNSIITPYILGKFSTDVRDKFDATRYFVYDGVSKLQLELGLLKEYELYNLSCDPTINSAFKGVLKLASDSDLNTSFQIVQGEDKEKISPDHINNSELKFDTGTEYTLNNIRNYNFINPISTDGLPSSIDIHYKFVVGYDISVTNIGLQQVPATTVCALYHLDEYGVYNVDDFGIHVIKNSQYDVYAPSVMYYNSGSADTELFGLCKIVDIGAATIGDLCVEVTQNSKAALPIKMAGKLNSGSTLREVVDLIGKYLFCQPHAHGVYASYVTNIHNESGGKSIQGSLNSSFPEIANTYNMSANTLRSLNGTEFISVVTGETLTGGTRFTALYGKEVAKFNRCMLETMKGVYAYNPDYDQIKVNRGDISVTDKLLKATSNILCTLAELDVTLTDYLRIGSVDMKEYLLDLSDMSSIPVKNNNEWLPTLSFKPDLTFVGSPDYYLVSSLTYNLPIPLLIYDDLELDFSKYVVVKHHDGTHDFIQGVMDKKSLYGWHETYKKLVALDVGTYDIDETGKLLIKDTLHSEELYKIEFTATELEELLAPTGGERTLEIERTLNSGRKVKFNVKFVFSPGGAYELGMATSKYYNRKETFTWRYWYAEFDNPIDLDFALYPTITSDSNSGITKCTIRDVDSRLESRTFYSSSGWSVGEYEASMYPGAPYYVSYYSFYGLTAKDRDVYILLDGRYLIHKTNHTYAILFKEEAGWNADWFALTVLDNGNLKALRNFSTSVDYDIGLHVTLNGYKKVVLNYFKSSENLRERVIVRGTIPSITLDLVSEKATKDFTESVIHFVKTPVWGKYGNTGYVTQYPSAAFVGSSITLNDLQYSPDVTGHRLFMKSDSFKQMDGNPIYYRLSSDSGIGNADCNALRLFSGPCYNTSIVINSEDPEYVNNGQL